LGIDDQVNKFIRLDIDVVQAQVAGVITPVPLVCGGQHRRQIAAFPLLDALGPHLRRGGQNYFEIRLFEKPDSQA
jgi:hypothetical protein